MYRKKKAENGRLPHKCMQNRSTLLILQNRASELLKTWSMPGREAYWRRGRLSPTRRSLIKRRAVPAPVKLGPDTPDKAPPDERCHQCHRHLLHPLLLRYSAGSSTSRASTTAATGLNPSNPHYTLAEASAGLADPSSSSDQRQPPPLSPPVHPPPLGSPAPPPVPGNLPEGHHSILGIHSVRLVIQSSSIPIMDRRPIDALTATETSMFNAYCGLGIAMSGILAASSDAHVLHCSKAGGNGPATTWQ